jgi:hypothetical protein
MSENQSEQPALPKPGEEVAGMKVVDPIAGLDEIRSERPGGEEPKPASKSKPGKAGKAKEVASADSIAEALKKALDDDDLTVEVVSAEEHPRGPVVAVKRLPDVTRPIAYIDSGGNTWEPGTLTLNLYGFLDSTTMETLQAVIKKALGISDSSVTTFTRF